MPLLSSDAPRDMAQGPGAGALRSFLGITLSFSTLGRRIVLSVFLASAALGTVATVVEYSLISRQKLAMALGDIGWIDSQVAPLVANALSEGRGDIAGLLAEAILAKETVAWVGLESAALGTAISRGDAAGGTLRSFPLLSGDGRELGTLTVAVTTRHVEALLQARFASILLFNLLQALVASVVIILIFDHLVSGHLSALARDLKRIRWNDELRLSVIRRQIGTIPYKIGTLLETMDDMREQTRAALRDTAGHAARATALNTLLEQAAQERAELIAALFHDLVVPINSIQTLATTAQLDAATLPPDTVADLRDMEAIALRMRRQIEMVQRYGQLLGAKADCVPVDLTALAQEVVAGMRAALGPARVEIDRLGTVPGDAAMLRELLRHLIENALAYRDPSRRLHVTLSAIESTGDITLCLADNGIGIAEAHQARVFELFRRLHAHGDIPGDGLGLAICRKIAERHGGEIGLSSEPGTGTTVYVKLRRPDQ